MRERSGRALDEAIAGAQLNEDRIKRISVESTSPAHGIHDLAQLEDVDLIVVGSSHSGKIGRALAGTVGVKLLHGSPCAVAIAPAGFRDRKDPELGLIAVGYDGEPEAERALTGAIDLARSVGAGLRLIGVARAADVGFESRGFSYPGTAQLDEAVADQMEVSVGKAVERVPDDIEVSSKVFSDRHESLADQEGIDLIVVGSRGYGPLRRVVLGSVSGELVRSSLYPVIVVPRGAKVSGEPAAETAGAVGSAG
jgi:nucleotide-binding universal stress UspA family protein